MEKSQSRILKISHVSVSQFKMWESLGLAKKNASLTVSQSLDFTICHPYMNLPFVVFKQTSCSKCAISHKHISLHSLMNNIYIYLTLSFKELIEGRRYFEIRKKFVSHCELFTIKNSGCYSDFEIPLSRLKYHCLG